MDRSHLCLRGRFWIFLSAVLYRHFSNDFYDVDLSLAALIVLSPLLLILTSSAR
jgi:hypothetical protein